MRSGLRTMTQSTVSPRVSTVSLMSSMSEISSMGKIRTVALAFAWAANFGKSTLAMAERMILFMWACGSITVTGTCVTFRRILMMSASGSRLVSIRVTASGKVLLRVRLKTSRSYPFQGTPCWSSQLPLQMASIDLPRPPRVWIVRASRWLISEINVVFGFSDFMG